VKFTEKGGIRIERFVPPSERFTGLQVIDTGKGMAPELLKQIGKAFVQEANAMTRTEGGTGLGLAISVRLAEEMGGRLSVTSRQGEGTIVTLVLPRADAPRKPDLDA